MDQGDELNDTAGVTGYVLNNSTFNRTGGTPSDSSRQSISIDVGGLTKSVYALNGSAPPTDPVEIKPGDELTYRIVYT